MKQIINQCLVAFFMILTVIILVFLLLIIPTSLASAETVSRDQILVIGKVTENHKKHYKTLKPMADYVVAKMVDLGMKETKVLMAKDNKQMISYLKQEKSEHLDQTLKQDLKIIYKTKNFHHEW